MGLLVEGDSQHDSHLQLRLDNRSFFNTQQSVFHATFSPRIVALGF